jgi:hypothetical protein
MRICLIDWGYLDEGWRLEDRGVNKKTQPWKIWILAESERTDISFIKYQKSWEVGPPCLICSGTFVIRCPYGNS